MPNFDPINIFKRLWEMRWWGRVLVIIAIVVTGLAIISPFTNKIIPILWAIIMAVIMWVLLILSYLEITRRIKKNLSILIANGEHILARLTGESWDSIDRYDTLIGEWDSQVKVLLRGTEYENFWKSNTGLMKEEPEDQKDPIQQSLAISRNYMRLRIIRLQQIKEKL
jgi:hypothetical protein